MKVVYLKDRSYRPAYIKKTCEFYPDLGDMLIGALERELSEPLDSLGIPDDMRRRIREGGP